MKLKPNQVKMGCKRGPIDPRWKIQVKTRAQNAAFEERRSQAGQKAPRQARGVHHGPWGLPRQLVVATTTVVPPFPLSVVLFSFVVVRFLRQFVLCFVFKKEDVSGLKGR